MENESQKKIFLTLAFIFQYPVSSGKNQAPKTKMIIILKNSDKPNL